MDARKEPATTKSSPSPVTTAADQNRQILLFFGYFVGVAVLLAASPVQAQQPYPYSDSPQELIQWFRDTNDTCRGSVDKEKGKAACETRSIISAQLEGKGYCLPPGPSSASNWRACRTQYEHGWWTGYPTQDGRKIYFDTRTVQDTWRPGFHRLVNADVIDAAGKVQHLHIAFDCAGKYKITNSGNGNPISIPTNTPLDTISKGLCLNNQATP